MPGRCCAPLWEKSGRLSCADMWGRRCVYLITLLGCLVFFGFYREWFSWFLLLAVVFLPVFSLALSIPAMKTAKVFLSCPESVRMGMPAKTNLRVECKGPTPPVSSRIRLHNSLTDTRYVGKPGERIPTDHCGQIKISYDRFFVYDYLGLFCRQLRKGDSCVVYVEPKPVPGSLPPEATGQAVCLWRPKPGGGFSENHDLRLYRPGDDVRSIHWKLAAKTGKLIYREPIEPVRKGYLLTMTLSGKPKELDRKLGQLLWLSQALLQRNLEHEIRCNTADGQVCFKVSDTTSQQEGFFLLLQSRPTKLDAGIQQEEVLWQHHVGGGGHEE